VFGGGDSAASGGGSVFSSPPGGGGSGGGGSGGGGGGFFDGGGGGSRTPLPDFDEESEESLLDLPSDAESESPFINPVATAEDVLSSDVEGGGLTAANGSSSGLLGGDR